MLRRGLKTLDELDAAEEKEKREAEQAALALSIPSGPSVAASGLDPGVEPDFDPSVFFWEVPGFVDGTQQASQGSSTAP